MSLTIQSIAYDNFRSYRSFSLEDIGQLTVFSGRNAVGKTNAIEGLQLITAQRTFRNATSEQLLCEDSEYGGIQALVTDGKRRLDVGVRIAEGKRLYSLNGKGKRTADMKGIIPSVTFNPDDLNIVKGGMSVRRVFLDSLGEQLSANHYLIRKDYEKLLRYKNRLLKEEADWLLVESVNEMMVTVGSQLTCYRMALLSKMAPLLEQYYAEISCDSERFSASYAPSWDLGDDLASGVSVLAKEEARNRMALAIEKAKGEEMARRRAVVGPHADKVGFFINGKPAETYGSQGQQRSIVLACKLAEISLINSMKQQQPVLLLDDVMSELDETRRRALVSFATDDIQTFITTANLSYFDDDLLSKARIVELSKDDEGTHILSDSAHS